MGKESTEEKKELMLIDESFISDKIHIVRGQKVMLDVDLAELYGYTTKAFNQQVKNNIERFDEDFRFQLTKEEVQECSRSKKLTLNQNDGRGHNIKYLPYAFTEQGIYMLMTVLKGELAVQQSKALIRIFKKMKDYMIINRGLIGEHEFLRLSMQVTQSSLIAAELREDLAKVEDQMAEIVENLNDVVYYSDLATYMKEFGDPHIKDGYLVYNGQPFRSDLIFKQIYEYAKKSIILIDNYINLKSLQLLIYSYKGVNITVYTDNLSKELTKAIFDDFQKEYPDMNIKLYQTGGIFHDRYIVLDYGTDRERIYLCGSSCKDGGRRISSILEDKDREKYHDMIDRIMKNSPLRLK